jgi:hypothetical protein
MTATILAESFSSPHALVDAAAGVIRNVKVLGVVSKNGRRYPTETLDRAAPLYEGARVNVDHPDPRRVEGPRRLSDRFGVLKDVRRQDDGLYADLHYLRSHPLASLLAEAASRMPETLGLSHHAEGRVRQAGEETIVEEIVRVRSVDLVGEPATTCGLFESREAETDPVPSISQGEPMNDHEVSLHEPIAAAVADSPSGQPQPDELLEEVRRLRGECESRDMLAASRLPAERPLIEALSLLPDRAARQRLIETIERMSRRSSERPLSLPRHSDDSPGEAPLDDAGQFARALRSR